MSKLKFEHMHAHDRFELLRKMVEIIAGEGCRGIADFAEKRHKAPLELWPEFCAEAGLDECEPWEGYPTSAPSLEMMQNSPGATTMLAEHAEWYERYNRAMGRDKN